MGACNAPDQAKGTPVIVLSEGEAAPFTPVGDCQYCGHEMQSLRPRALQPFGPSDGRRYALLTEVPQDLSGRVRISLSWNSCTDINAASAPSQIATDFDLFLVDPDQRKVFYSSQSIDDNNEGFDINLTTFFGPGHYQIWLAWPEGATGCGGVGTERVAWVAKFYG